MKEPNKLLKKVLKTLDKYIKKEDYQHKLFQIIRTVNYFSKFEIYILYRPKEEIFINDKDIWIDIATGNSEHHQILLDNIDYHENKTSKKRYYRYINLKNSYSINFTLNLRRTK